MTRKQGPRGLRRLPRADTPCYPLMSEFLDCEAGDGEQGKANDKPRAEA
jgi:hypothetical protein